MNRTQDLWIFCWTLSLVRVDWLKIRHLSNNYNSLFQSRVKEFSVMLPVKCSRLFAFYSQTIMTNKFLKPAYLRRKISTLVRVFQSIETVYMQHIPSVNPHTLPSMIDQRKLWNLKLRQSRIWQEFVLPPRKAKETSWNDESSLFADDTSVYTPEMQYAFYLKLYMKAIGATCL